MLEECLSALMNVGCGEWSRKGKSCSLRLLGLASNCGNLPSMPVLGIGEAPPFGSHFANLPFMQRVVLIALYREHSALAELNFLVRGIALIWRSRRDKTQAISVRVEETKAKQFQTGWAVMGGVGGCNLRPRRDFFLEYNPRHSKLKGYSPSKNSY